MHWTKRNLGGSSDGFSASYDVGDHTSAMVGGIAGGVVACPGGVMRRLGWPE